MTSRLGTEPGQPEEESHVQNRIKLTIVGLASALAVAVVALALVALRPAAEATPASGNPAGIDSESGVPVGAEDAGQSSARPSSSDSKPTSSGSGTGTGVGTGSGGETGGGTGGGNGGSGTTTTTTTQPPGGGGGGGGGGVKPPKFPIKDVLADPPLVLDPGSPTPTTTVPPEPEVPCRNIKLCPDFPF